MAAGPLAASPEEIQERLRASQESLARFQRAQMQTQKAEESEAELLAIDRHEQLFERFDMSDSLASGENEAMSVRVRALATSVITRPWWVWHFLVTCLTL